MVERLRRSLEGLEPPVCPNCHIEMSWYRSMMVARSPLTIDHYFACPNCEGIVRTQSITPGGANIIPPEKLLAPRRRFRCAA